MSGEQIVVYGTQKTLESNGNSIASGSLFQASGANYAIETDGASFPDGLFALVCTFTTAPTEGSVFSLYAQPTAIDGTVNTEVPEPTRPTRFIGNFVVNNVTTTQGIELVAYDLPRKALYYLHNVNTGQAVNAGWTLKVTPRTFKSA